MSSTILGQRNHLIPKNYIPCLCFIAHLRLTPCNPMDCSLPGSSVHRDSPGKNTGVGCHALFQGIFPTQGSNLGLPHCRQILHQLSHQGSLYLPCLPRFIPLRHHATLPTQWVLPYSSISPHSSPSLSISLYVSTSVSYTHASIVRVLSSQDRISYSIGKVLNKILKNLTSQHHGLQF